MRRLNHAHGVIIGVGAVIAMVSIGQGAQASVQAQISSFGTNLLFVSAGAQTLAVSAAAPTTATNTLTERRRLQAIQREVPSISSLSRWLTRGRG
jgi:ABC-type antimicrobial peptide transport system permease subunit